MYYSFGLEENLRNAMLLGLQSDSKLSFETWKDIKQGLHKFLQQKQDSNTWDYPDFHLESDTKKALTLLDYYRFFDSKQDDDPVQDIDLNFSSSVQNISTDCFKNHLENLSNIDSNLHSLFRCIVNVVFFYPSKTKGGGSTPRAVGIIWCNPGERWTSHDYYEFMLHELTHNLLFLDESVHTHYTNRDLLANYDTYVPSSIRKTKRRVDLALHSLVVASEVLEFRKKHGESALRFLHPSSESLITSAKITSDAIIESDSTHGLLTHRGREIVQKCHRFLQSI